MKKTKIILDTLMLITIILTMLMKLTGNKIHEILGILFLVEFILHKLLNIKPIKAMLNACVKPKANKNLKTVVVTDIILTILMVLATISGIYISKHIFNISTSFESFWYIMHAITSYGAVIVLLIHVFLHTNQIITTVNNIFKLKTKKYQKTIFNIFLLLCLGLFINIFIKTKVVSKIKNANTFKEAKPKIEITTDTNNIERFTKI